MSNSPQMFLVCYDIGDPKRLHKVYKTMRGFGDPLQLSVFRCVLSAVQLARLRDILSQIVHASEDQVLFVQLGSAEAQTTWRTSTLGAPLVHPDRVARIV